MGARTIKKGILVMLDIAIIYLSYFIAFIFRFMYDKVQLKDIVRLYSEGLIKITFICCVFIVTFSILRHYKNIWHNAGMNEFVRSGIASLIATMIVVILSTFVSERISIAATLIAGVLVALLTIGVRVMWSLLRRGYISLNYADKRDFKGILVVGAGTEGVLVTNEYKNNLQYKSEVIAFVDDSKERIGTYVSGVKVYGDRYSIENIAKSKKIDEIIIAIPSLKEKELKKILDECKKTSAKVKVMPDFPNMFEEGKAINKIREVQVEDLLGREQVKLDYSGIKEYIENKRVIVTGGGGSIGSEMCRQIAQFNPKELIIFDIYENSAYDLQNELLRKFKGLNLKTLIGSVRDRERLEQVFKEYKPEVVFHAAAHKHVPLMEESPGEAIKNNVCGTLNTAEVASEYKVERFVLISTDKAVNPTNVMGATKRLCEMVIQAIDKKSRTDFVAVRFGNVLGSNGSVVPLFKKQIEEGGPVTLTHKDITRYFMLIPEAAQLVLQAGAFAKGGEIFVLDMGEPVKIYDLAENLIKLSGFEPNKDIRIKITGLRPGEKLYEELLMNEEGLKETSHSKIFIGVPSEFELGELKLKIKELVEVATKEDKEVLKERLKDIVPTFVEPKEVNEVAITKK